MGMSLTEKQTLTPVLKKSMKSHTRTGFSQALRRMLTAVLMHLQIICIPHVVFSASCLMIIRVAGAMNRMR